MFSWSFVLKVHTVALCVGIGAANFADQSTIPYSAASALSASDAEDCADGEGTCTSVHMVQWKASKNRFRQQPQELPASASVSAGSAESTCTRLLNRGTHSTVRVEVGTPPQRFEVVADTGSDNLVVASCACQRSNYCLTTDRCFQGSGQSSTFEVGDNATDEDSPDRISLSFGSGTVETVAATDVVQVGQVQARMEDVLLLMVEKHLDFGGPFEGILGLGQSNPNLERNPLGFTVLGSSMRRHRKGIFDGGPVGFLDSAGISRFSICLDHQVDGVLRFAEPVTTTELASIGQDHWALLMQEASAGVPGSNASRINICGAGDTGAPRPPCVAIPDSGTTSIMGTHEGIERIYATLCSQWPRCRDEVARSNTTFALAFQSVLLDCDDWVVNVSSWEELPALNFRLADSDGQQVDLSIPPESYLFTREEHEVEYLKRYFLGVFPSYRKRFGKKRRVCVPAFGALDLDSAAGEEVWVLGTPLFYAYRVGFDMQRRSISFVDDECGSCEDGLSLVSSQVGVESQRARAMRYPRAISGPLRVSHPRGYRAM